MNDNSIAILPLSQNTGEMWLGSQNRSGSWSYDGDKIAVILSRRLPVGGIRKEEAIEGHVPTVADAKEALRAWIENDRIAAALTETARHYIR